MTAFFFSYSMRDSLSAHIPRITERAWNARPYVLTQRLLNFRRCLPLSTNMLSSFVNSTTTPAFAVVVPSTSIFIVDFSHVHGRVASKYISRTNLEALLLMWCAEVSLIPTHASALLQSSPFPMLTGRRDTAPSTAPVCCFLWNSEKHSCRSCDMPLACTSWGMVLSSGSTTTMLRYIR